MTKASFHPGDAAAASTNRAAVGIDDQEPVWLSIKRVVPLSRTLELLQGFFIYCRTHPAGRLVVICGDDLSDYAAEVRAFISASPHAERVHLVGAVAVDAADGPVGCNWPTSGSQSPGRINSPRPSWRRWPARPSRS